MRKSEKDLLRLLHNNVDSFDNVEAVIPAGNRPELRNQAGNPPIQAQFDIQFIAKYFTLNAGNYTEIAAAALNAGLKNDLPFFVFGNSDFAGGFSKIQGQFPVNSNWTYGRAGIYGKDDFNELAFDATVTGTLENGDLVIPLTSALPGTGTTTLALMIVRCSTVPYGTLLDALNSDRFVMNGIRFNLDDTTLTAQFSKQLKLIRLSLFGKYKFDNVSPASYKKPEQFQNGIVDIPITYGVDKQTAIGFYNLYTNVSFSWSIFVKYTEPLKV